MNFKNKLFVTIFILLSIFSYSYADKQTFIQLPSNFKPECFEYYKIIPSSDFINNKTLTISLDRSDIFAKQGNNPIWLSDYKNNFNNIDYISDLNLDIGILSDNNDNTFVEIDTDNNKEIKLNFTQELKANSFSFNFDYYSSYYDAIYFINGNSRVNKTDIKNFDIKSLTIKFESSNNTNFREKIKIYELYFKRNGYTKLLSSAILEGTPVEFFSSYKCKGFFNYDIPFQNNLDYNLDKNTKIIYVKLEKNPLYNPIIESDLDNDKVSDDLDNCKYIYNPIQEDKNGDGIGNLCSDDDNDGIIGKKDNCIDVSNFDQKDINRNFVGDVCEFDFDLDGIFDSLDNCRSISNSDQIDGDNDGIGNLCDNCEQYNPNQEDKNNNSIGDECERIDKELEENDIDKDDIIDWEDNCKEISNTYQLDEDNDGIGDACDNCRQLQNYNQIDLDKNGIGDFCEDSDKDGVIGHRDNCINISNPDQKDDNNDGIGNLCEDKDFDKIVEFSDNCPHIFNPNQSDIDNDKIGDECDEKDDRFIESNKWFFVGVLVLLITIFAIGIYYMLRKINSK